MQITYSNRVDNEYYQSNTVNYFIHARVKEFIIDLN